MLFTDPSFRTERLTDATALKLRESDGVDRYQDCGWHCATGYKDGRVYVMVHADCRADLDDALGVCPERGTRHLPLRVTDAGRHGRMQ